MSDEEQWLLKVSPSLRSKPMGFIGIILLVAVGILAGIQWPDHWGKFLLAALGISFVWLIVMFIQTRMARLEITDRRSIVSRGFISRQTSEVLHKHVRNVQVTQSIYGRIVGIGNIGMSSAGQADVEIEFKNVKYSAIEKVQDLIEKHRGD